MRQLHVTTSLHTHAEASTPNWYAVQVWAGREHLAAVHLRARNYDVFLPCYRVHHRWSDRLKQIEEALFAGYLFIALQPDAGASIVSAPGVVRIVGDSRGPIPVPLCEIESLRRLVETKLNLEPSSFVRVGQRVCVHAGPLRDAEGFIVRIKGHNRLVVSISVLERSVSVEMDASWITVPISARMAEG